MGYKSSFRFETIFRSVEARSHLNYLDTLKTLNHVIRHEIFHIPRCSGEHFSCCSCPLSLCYDKHLGILERNLGAVSSPGLRSHPQTILIDIVASRTGIEIFPEPARSQTSRTLLPFDRTLGMLDLYPEMRASSPATSISCLASSPLSLNLAWKYRQFWCTSSLLSRSPPSHQLVHVLAMQRPKAPPIFKTLERSRRALLLHSATDPGLDLKVRSLGSFFYATE